MRKVFSSASGSIRPQFEVIDPPESEIPREPADTDRVWDQAQRILDVQEMKDTWAALSSPTTESPMFSESSFPPGALRLLKRGKVFADLVDEHGINQAAKKARVLVCNRKKAFQAGANDLSDAIRARNLEVVRLRSLRGAPTVPTKPHAGQSRRSSML